MILTHSKTNVRMINAPLQIVNGSICTKWNMRDECHTFTIVKGCKIHFSQEKASLASLTLSAMPPYNTLHTPHHLAFISTVPCLIPLSHIRMDSDVRKSELSVFVSAKNVNIESVFVFNMNVRWMYSNPVFNIIHIQHYPNYLTKIRHYSYMEKYS
jgi:hypothetical protein